MLDLCFVKKVCLGLLLFFAKESVSCFCIFFGDVLEETSVGVREMRVLSPFVDERGG